MTPRLRFVVWVICVVGSLLLTPAWLIARDAWPVLIAPGWLVLTALLIAFAALLLTTPPDAIKLPRSISLAMIGLGTIWLQAFAFDPSVLGLAVCAVAIALLGLRPPKSPWWATLVGWNPLLLAELFPRSRLWIAGISIVFVLLLLAVSKRARPR